MTGARTLLTLASLLLCGGGTGLTLQGAAVPVKAHVAQDRLQQVFAQQAMVSEGGTAAVPSPRGPSALPPAGPVARIAVERLGVAHIILADDGTEAPLERAPTLLQRSDGANPVTILAGHRDTHFLFVRDLLAGDVIMLQLVTGAVERYRVIHFETVRHDAFGWPRDPARPLLALTTCFPFGGTEYGGPWRRVAWAERIV